MAKDPVVKHKVLMMGGSAGSLDGILKIAAALPVTDHLVTIIIVHRKNESESILADLLSSRTRLNVKEVEDKEPIIGGNIYVAPADYHLLVENENMFSLDYSEKVHHSRPSIDVSFESAAHVFGDAVTGVLLSGANADGAEGLCRIQEAGGFTIVQDPVSAEVDYMPQQAIALMKPDKILNIEGIADFLSNIIM
jgi:two-component system chemotaxis response regulator CheB